MESEVIRRAQHGDQAAFQQLVEQYGQLAWRTAAVLLNDRTAVEDAVQEAWLDIWHGLSSFDPSRPLRPWMLTIVTNRCRKLARHYPPPMLSLDADVLTDRTATHDVEAHTLRMEADAELLAAIATLSADQRRILELHFFADLALTEIAIVTNLPIGTVKSRLHRALQALRMHLRHQHPLASLAEELP